MEKGSQFVIGQKLKKLRMLFGYEQKHLADILHVGQSYYSKIETFDIDKHLKFISPQAKIYHIDEKYILEECILDQYIDNAIEFSRQYHLLTNNSIISSK